MSRPTRNMPSSASSGADQPGEAEHGVVHLHGLGAGPGRHVGPGLPGRRDPPEGRLDAVGLEDLPVEEEQPDVAVGGLGQFLLAEEVAVAGHRLDHLVQVDVVFGVENEHAVASRPLEGFDDGLAVVVGDEGPDLVARPG